MAKLTKPPDGEPKPLAVLLRIDGRLLESLNKFIRDGRLASQTIGNSRVVRVVDVDALKEVERAPGWKAGRSRKT